MSEAPSMSAAGTGAEDQLHRILCVDDEPRVLEGLSRMLELDFDVTTADGGQAGLDCMASTPPFAVVMSDMRMPEMNGATFLTKAHAQFPDTVRLLLTGHSEMDAAVAAVNEGRIFRFLTKPCPRDTLIAALNDAVAQHRLITSERVLLEETLHGSMRMMMEVMTLVGPDTFGRALRMKQMTAAVVKDLGLPDGWSVELAAVMTGLAQTTLPAATMEKLHAGADLPADERAVVDRCPEIADRLLAGIPRLERVRQVIGEAGSPLETTAAGNLSKGAQVLRALHLYLLWSAGEGRDGAIKRLRAAQWPADIVDSLVRVSATLTEKRSAFDARLRDLRPGMRLEEEVLATNGMTIVPGGREVTVALIERLANFAAGIGVREPLKVSGN